MKHTTPFFLIALLISVSCCEQKKNAKDEIYKKVMAVHDEIMPKIGPIMNYKKQLNEKIDGYIENGVEANADKIIELENAVENLVNSHEEMMNWMHEFDNDFEGMVEKEVMDYLNDQMEKIEHVGKVTNNALKNAEKLLGK